MVARTSRPQHRRPMPSAVPLDEPDGMVEDASLFFSDMSGGNKRSRQSNADKSSEGKSMLVGEAVDNKLATLPGSQQTQDRVTWLELGLCKSLVRAVSHLGFMSPTPVQVEAIPAALSGRDLCARAVTGSGKTAAFLLPMSHLLLTRPPQKQSAMRSQRRYIRAVILVPTRELGVQCETMLKQLLQFTTGLTVALAIGGVAPAAQEAALDAAPDILIATPGRLVDFVHNFHRGAGLDLSGVEVVVLDECDKMLTVTLVDQVIDILEHVPNTTRQVLLFSATMTPEVDVFATEHLFEPHNVDIGHVALQSKLRQQFVRISLEECEEESMAKNEEEVHAPKPRIRSKRLREEEKEGGEESGRQPTGAEGQRQQLVTMAKTRSLVALCQHYFKEKTIIFCKYRTTTHRLALLFHALKLSAVEVQGNQEQLARLQALEQFASGNVKYLLTTDVASRGLDVPDVVAVINYDLPPTLTAYIHRVGRTARVGASGTAVSLVDESCDGEIMKKILAVSGTMMNDFQVASVKRRDLPAEVLRQAKADVDGVFGAVKAQLEAEELEERIAAAEKRYGKTGEFVDAVVAKPKKTWILSKEEQRQREESARKAYEKEAEVAVNRYQNMLSNLDREERDVLRTQTRQRRAARQKKQQAAEKEEAKLAAMKKKTATRVERDVIKKLKKKKIRAAVKERRAAEREKKGQKPYVRRERRKGGRVKDRRNKKMKKH